jgi:transposase-like protein
MTTKQTEVCPDCDHSRIRVRHHGKLRSHPDTSERYRCCMCTATFDEPATRPARNNSTPKRGLAARLAKADPDDVSRGDTP